MACYPWFFEGLKEWLGRRLGWDDELCVGGSFKEAEVDLYWCVVLWRGFDSFTRLLDIELRYGWFKRPPWTVGENW